MSATDPVPAPAPRSATRTVVIAALALVVTFIAGFVVGAVTDRFMVFHGRPHRPPRMAAQAMIERLDRHLDLDDRQRERIAAILQQRHTRINRAVRSEIEAANAEIERILTPEQREKFQKVKMRLGERRHGGKWRTNAPGGPPPLP